MKKPTAKTLNAIDMSPILDNIPSTDTNRIYIAQEAGREHYRLFLFAYLVKSGKFTKVTFGGFVQVGH